MDLPLLFFFFFYCGETFSFTAHKWYSPIHISTFFCFFLFIMYARKRRIEAEQRLYNIQQGKVQKPDVYGSRKKPPAVKNSDQDDEFFENVNDDNLVMNSDAVSAAEYLIKINPRSSIPICFVHQIYSVLPNNNTVTDRELVSRRERVYMTHTVLICMNCIATGIYKWFLEKISHHWGLGR